MILRDAAEKGWLAVNKAVEALLKTYGVEAKTYKENRDHLLKTRFRLVKRKIRYQREVSSYRLFLRRII
jgi:poly-D-alanine transfer protein DltD